MSVKEHQGRVHSVKTAEDKAKEIQDLIKSLTPEEYKAMEVVIKQLQDPSGVKTILDELKETQYIRQPVSMLEFITNPYYLGEACENLYEELRKDLMEVEHGGYEDFWWVGSTRTGKTECSSVFFIWQIYLLSCLKDPQESLGLSKGSKISGIVISVSEKIALEVAFSSIESKLAQSKYFKDIFPYKNNKGTLIFPNNILVVAKATTDRSALGHNIAIAWIDEAAFLSQGKATTMDPRLGFIDQAQLIYQSIKTRMKNTFKASKFKGIMIVSSSKTSKTDFIARFISANKNNSKLFIRDRNAWTILPDLYKDSPKFKVLCGNELMLSRIVEPSEEHLYTDLPDGVTIIEVPVEFEPDFRANLEKNIQDLAGIFTSAVSPFIQRREKILEACDPTLWPSFLFNDKTQVPLLQHTFSVKEWDPTYTEATFLWDKLIKEYPLAEYDGSYTRLNKPIINPRKPRFVHLDPAFRSDSFGLAIGHVAGLKQVERRSDEGIVYLEKAPVYVIDIVLRITPPLGGEIEMATVRGLIYQLIKHGMPITTVTMDKFVRDGLQPFQAKGLKTDWTSVDETTEPYDILKSALYENRIYFYKYDRLILELQTLEKVFEGKRIKIDHPPTGSKDVADAVAGLVYNLSKQKLHGTLSIIKGTKEDQWMEQKLGRLPKESFPYDFNARRDDPFWQDL